MDYEDIRYLRNLNWYMIQPNENNVGNNKNIKNRNNHRYDNNDEDVRLITFINLIILPSLLNGD
ncbi:hypothetical protein BCR32DRAFT_297281 [Anaeromyces robustus]|uniref:Uncharacterized protein n=1 Tax=Anaeromyces robustus TaxID=1754192 RepID=A0A1Y1WE30_9FUNG|nr:hypothetical protein BCR32DRAFT_297281 [Anaeromyces robustus]|eukprot:ORX71712.1 hypothetical protein BCR32DRAFT_297281 [Anaeromyces robustus]